MKKIAAKLRSKSFWVALAGALTLILSRLGYADAATLAQNVIDGIGGVLLIFGIAVSPCGVSGDKTQTADSEQEDSVAECGDADNKKKSE